MARNAKSYQSPQGLYQSQMRENTSLLLNVRYSNKQLKGTDFLSGKHEWKYFRFFISYTFLQFLPNIKIESLFTLYLNILWMNNNDAFVNLQAVCAQIKKCPLWSPITRLRFPVQWADEIRRHKMILFGRRAYSSCSRVMIVIHASVASRWKLTYTRDPLNKLYEIIWLAFVQLRIRILEDLLNYAHSKNKSCFWQNVFFKNIYLT